jgi:MFS family permease
MLLRERRFLPLFVTQFLGAMNDNMLRNALVVLLVFDAATWTELKPEMVGNLATGVFVLPMLLFSATAGHLADRYDKAGLARFYKLLGIAAVLVAGIGFRLQSVPLLMTALFMQGMTSALFGPIKYAILPQHLKPGELVGGNALIAAGSFVAILLGTLLGTLLAGVDRAAGFIMVASLAIAVTGLLASWVIPAAPPPAPKLRISLNPFGQTWRSMKIARENPTVFVAILGISWFWLYGAMFLAQFPAFAMDVLGGSESTVTLLLVTFTLGIGIGSFLCERLSAGRVELSLVAAGAIGMSLAGLDLAFAAPDRSAATPLAMGELLAIPGTWRVLLDLALLGTFGGLFIVPLYALIQQRSSVHHRARIIGANNVFNALFMVGGALGAAGLQANGVSIPVLFGIAAFGNAAMAACICRWVPGFPATLRVLFRKPGSVRNRPS